MKLKELRQNSNLTQEELAKKLGFSRDTYKNYEQHRTEPNIQTLIHIADFYNISLDYLCERQNKDLLFIDSLSENKKNLINMIKELNEEETLIAIGWIARLTNKSANEIIKNIK